MKKGIVGIITGEGKGKTSSAIGLAVRSAGWQKKVLIIQFFKARASGERKLIKKLDNIELKQFGQAKLVNFNQPSQTDREAVNEAWQYCQKSIKQGDYDLLILDEINLAIHFKLLDKTEILNLIKTRDKLNIILTGRKADQDLMKEADFVSQVDNLKHHFQQGAKPRRGIEY